MFRKTLIIALAAFALAACKEEAPKAQAPEPAKPRTVSMVPEPWPSDATKPANLEMDPLPTRDNFAVVVDFSGSMAEGRCAGSFPSKAEATRQAFVTWLNTVPAEANVGLVVFDSQGVRRAVELGFNNRDVLRDAVFSAKPDGGTPLRSALTEATRMLEQQAHRQRGYGTYRTVVITDGEHSMDQDPAGVIDRIMRNPNNMTEIHTIGFCIEDSALNRPGATFYRSAANPEELAAGLSEVLAESADFDAASFDPNSLQEIQQ